MKMAGLDPVVFLLIIANLSRIGGIIPAQARQLA